MRSGCAGPWPFPLGGSRPGIGRAPGRVSACEAVGLIECVMGVLEEKQGRWESTEANLRDCVQVWPLRFKEDIEVLECVERRAAEVVQGLDHETSLE